MKLDRIMIRFENGKNIRTLFSKFMFVVVPQFVHDPRERKGARGLYSKDAVAVR